MSIATRRGDKGTTGLYYGGRVAKHSARIECNGAVDEAQAFLGQARALLASAKKSPAKGFQKEELDDLLVSLERDLWVLMAEVATLPSNRRKLVEGTSLVTKEMLARLDGLVERLEAAEVMPAEFTVPGQCSLAAALDVARTVVRRAERRAVALKLPEASLVVSYLNRLSDVCWLLARAAEAEHLTARTR